MDIKKLSTHRLLNIFRIVRRNIWSREPESEYGDYHEEEDLFFSQLKEELDKREHVPRKKRNGQ